MAHECQGDEELRREVESLLAQNSSPQDVLDRPAWEGAASLLGSTTVPQLQSTETYQRTPPPTGERVRMGLRAAKSLSLDCEIQVLLRRRLLIAAGIVSTASALVVLLQWFFGIFLNTIIVALIVAVTTAGLAYLLWTCPALALWKLRIVELTIVGLVAVYYLLFQSTLPHWHVLAGMSGGFETYLPSLQTDAVILRWFAFIVGYGIFIPNTLRRSAVVVGGLALMPIVFNACNALMQLDRWSYWDHLVGQWAFWMTLAATLAIYGSHKISVLRQQAFQARKLGHYQLKHRLGVGGMGEVYLAEHVLLRRSCAVKLIRPERAGDPKNLIRFEREAQMTAALTHPNTVQVFDYGHADDGTFYCAMEYLPGPNLEQMVKLHGKFSPRRAIYILGQVCAALQEAHRAGLIHRDIKPSNIIISERGGVYDVAKLVDFGLVQTFGRQRDNDKLTQEGAIAGTPTYMSPEQISGKDVDARSDIYSLGCVAYFLLTGQPPFASHSSVQILAAHLYEAPPPMTTRIPNLPSNLESVVLRCLAKDPAERFRYVRHLDQALAACIVEQWTEEDAADWWRCERVQNSRRVNLGSSNQHQTDT